MPTPTGGPDLIPEEHQEELPQRGHRCPAPMTHTGERQIEQTRV